MSFLTMKIDIDPEFHSGKRSVIGQNSKSQLFKPRALLDLQGGCEPLPCRLVSLNFYVNEAAGSFATGCVMLDFFCGFTTTSLNIMASSARKIVSGMLLISLTANVLAT